MKTGSRTCRNEQMQIFFWTLKKRENIAKILSKSSDNDSTCIIIDSREINCCMVWSELPSNHYMFWKYFWHVWTIYLFNFSWNDCIWPNINVSLLDHNLIKVEEFISHTQNWDNFIKWQFKILWIWLKIFCMFIKLMLYTSISQMQIYEIINETNA